MTDISQSGRAVLNGVQQNRKRVMLIQAWWRDGILHGVGRYAREHNWILDCQMRWNQRLPVEERYVSDGFIAYVGEEVTNVPHVIKYVKSFARPIVDLSCYGTHFNGIRVAGDNFERGALAARHLISLGFQNLVFVRNEYGITQAKREDGFLDAAANAGITPVLIRHANLLRDLPTLPRPLGLSSANDHTAISAINTCMDLGIHVPEEVAVVGIDDTDVICDLAPIPLSSVNFNDEIIGYRAAEMLDRLMNNEKLGQESIIVPSKGVTVRASSDTLAIFDLSTAKALRFIRSEFRRPIQIKDIPRNGRSLRWIQKQFQQHAGLAMIDELIRLRLNHAKKLLTTTSMKVESVGYESGFSNRSHFATTFKKQVGSTPTTYRMAGAELTADSN